MNIKTYYCPQRGSSLQADENTTFINCSNCGYGFNVLSNTKRFVSDDGVLLGTAIVPDNYEISGDYEAL